MNPRRHLRKTVRNAIGAAFDALVANGWQPGELLLKIGPEPMQFRLCVAKGAGGSTWDNPVFEIMLTSEPDASPPRVNIFERWLLSALPTPERL